MSSLAITNVRKSFHDGSSHEPIRVLDDISFVVQGPNVVSIVGPNGVGKSTLLRLLAGLTEPDNGSITIDGAPPARCRIGYVPQSNPIFPWRRVIDDIAVPLEIQGLPVAERRFQVERVVKHFSLDLPLERRSHGLSGGQRQLVNLCRALVGDVPPGVLLLDEPFSALDPGGRLDFLRHLQVVFDEVKPLVFLTTHHMDLAVMVSDIILPFQSSPVALSQKDSIPVPLSRPRSDKSKTEPKFREVLQSIEHALGST